MSHDANFEQVEALNDRADKQSLDHAVLEGQDGLGDLNQQVLKEQEDLKAGKSSGITGEFGKPAILDQSLSTYDTNRTGLKSGQNGLAYELKNVMTDKNEGYIQPYDAGSPSPVVPVDERRGAGLLGWLVDEKESETDLTDEKLGLLLPGIQRKVTDFWRNNDDLAISQETEHPVKGGKDDTVSWSWGETQRKVVDFWKGPKKDKK